MGGYLAEVLDGASLIQPTFIAVYWNAYESGN
ncbi:hypothetical protein HCH_03716 [Hahella chejuensis KCTC 2396]|uniref:Uncharacterized protein n=1 Tax=Hahella chejuensis (strain KCTC 2396) TaxID=349521 RepID=Q2SFX2_HAHCH|nr:hypothetical protein HCH_03716 [Hahella chejuensis KCTC 2396]